MLRYTSRLPSLYQEAFVAGIKENKSDFLSSDWEIRAKLMDSISLLSLCTSEESENRPNTINNIKAILIETIHALKKEDVFL